MKPLRINEGAWHSYKANLNFIATSVLAFGVMVGQTDSGSGDLAYDILPIAQFESTSESNEFEEYIGSVDGSGNDLGKWLSSLFVKLKLMQITGMRLIGLTISSTLSNFDLCSEKFLKHLEKILDFMPRQKELRVLVLDSEDSAVKQALTIDFESRKARADEFVLEHEDIDLKILVKTQLTISSMSVVSSNSKQTDSEILNEQIRAYSSRITGFIAAHAGVILSSSQSLECIQGLGRYIDEVHLDLYGDEQGAKFENKSAECADQESKKITIDGTFELRCYVSLKATVFEILSLLAKDFVNSFNNRIELASWENNDFDSSAGKLNKNKTFGFNLARRGFLRVEAHPYVLYQDYLTGTEVERDSRRRISRNTSVYAEVLGDFEVNKLILTGKGVPRKLIVMQEVKQDKRIFEQLTAIKTQSVKQFKAFTGKTLQDPSDLMKRFLFAGLALASLATFRSIYLDHYVDFI